MEPSHPGGKSIGSLTCFSSHASSHRRLQPPQLWWEGLQLGKASLLIEPRGRAEQGSLTAFPDVATANSRTDQAASELSCSSSAPIHKEDSASQADCGGKQRTRAARRHGRGQLWRPGEGSSEEQAKRASPGKEDSATAGRGARARSCSSPGTHPGWQRTDRTLTTRRMSLISPMPTLMPFLSLTGRRMLMR